MTDFEPENELEQALVYAAREPAALTNLLRVFRESLLFVVNTSLSEEERAAYTRPQVCLNRVPFEGVSCVAAFSSLRRLRESLARDALYIALGAIDLLRVIEGAPLVLDPHSPYARRFSADELRGIADGSLLRAEPLGPRVTR